MTGLSLNTPLPPQSMLTRTACTLITFTSANDGISSQFSTVKCNFNIDFGGKGDFLAMSANSQYILELIVCLENEA